MLSLIWWKGTTYETRGSLSLDFIDEEIFRIAGFFASPLWGQLLKWESRANAEFSPFLQNSVRDDNIHRRSCGNPQLLFFGFSVSRSTDCIESSLSVNINESTALASLGIHSELLVNESQNTCWPAAHPWLSNEILYFDKCNKIFNEERKTRRHVSIGIADSEEFLEWKTINFLPMVPMNTTILHNI